MPVNPPFDIDAGSPSANDLVSAYPPDERTSRDVIESWLTFISNPSTGMLKASAATDIINAISIFPAGTKMIFVQTAAPTGWTKVADAAYNDAALRIVTGSVTPTGGTVGFATAFTSQAVTGSVGSTILTAAQMPAHTHTFTDTANTGTVSADHTHNININSNINSASHTHVYGLNAFSATIVNGTQSQTTRVNSVTATTTDPGGSGDFSSANTSTQSANHVHNVAGGTSGITVNHFHTVTVSGTTSSVGSGTGHNHTFTGTAIDLAVKYVDCIVATKD